MENLLHKIKKQRPSNHSSVNKSRHSHRSNTTINGGTIGGGTGSASGAKLMFGTDEMGKTFDHN